MPSLTRPRRSHYGTAIRTGNSGVEPNRRTAAGRAQPGGRRETGPRCRCDPRADPRGRCPAVAYARAGRRSRGLPSPGAAVPGSADRRRDRLGHDHPHRRRGRSASASTGPTAVRPGRSSCTCTAAAGRSATSTPTTPSAGGSRAPPTAWSSPSTIGCRRSSRTRRRWTTRSRPSAGWRRTARSSVATRPGWRSVATAPAAT